MVINFLNMETGLLGQEKVKAQLKLILDQTLKVTPENFLYLPYLLPLSSPEGQTWY